MVKLLCCRIRKNNALCNVGPMCKLILVLAIMMTAFLIGSFFSSITIVSLGACWECPKYDYKNFTGYNGNPARCRYINNNGAKSHEDRVYNITCRNKVLISVPIGVSMLVLINFILTLTFWRTFVYYDKLDEQMCCCLHDNDDCGQFCNTICLFNYSETTYPRTDRCCFNLKVLGKSFLISLLITILILTASITVPIAISCLIIGCCCGGCYFLTSNFCPFTCDICTLNITTEKDDHVPQQDKKNDNNNDHQPTPGGPVMGEPALV